MKRQAREVPAYEYGVIQDIAALGARVWDVLVIRDADVFLYRKFKAGFEPDLSDSFAWPGDDVRREPSGVYVLRRYKGDPLPLLGLYHQHLQPRRESPALWTLLVERSGVLPAPRLTVTSNPSPKPSRRKDRPRLHLVQGGVT